MPRTIRISESSPRLPSHWPGGEVELEFSNERPTAPNLEQLLERLRLIKGRDAVRTLRIAPSSHLSDLRVVEFFPKIEFLQLDGLRLKSLDGIQQLGTELVIEIDTGKNKRRRIDALGDSRAVKLTLHHVQAADFPAVSRAPRLEELALTRAGNLPTAQRWTSPVRTLGLHAGGFTELKNLAQLPKLRDLLVVQCGKLTRFSGNNENIEWLVLGACKKFDSRSLVSMPRLRVLAASQCRISVRALSNLSLLEELRLDGCKIDLDAAFKSLASLERLKRVTLSGVPSSTAKEFSAAVRQANVAWE